MNFLFIGTGAADWDWSDPASRGSTCTLIDGHILIDAGPTVLSKMADKKADPARITHIFITHSHPDHFIPANVAAIAETAAAPVQIYAAPQALGMIPPCGNLEKHALKPGMHISVGSMTFTALPSNHTVADIAEETFHFLIDTPEKRVLYALDGAWICGKAKRMLEGRIIDLIIWDATCGETLCDRRFAEHNDLEMIRMMRTSMLKTDMISLATKHVFDHLARTLWPQDPDAIRALARKYDGISANDGMALDL